MQYALNYSGIVQGFCPLNYSIFWWIPSQYFLHFGCIVCCFISFCLFLSLFGVLFWFRVMFLVSHLNNLEWNIFQKCQRITYFCISETNWACIYYICHKRKITSTFEKHCPIMALDMYFCASSINKFEIMHALILKM